ncbi:MAG: glycosyltransferase family 4 protein [Fibrobacter sp.]|nr:glycosyltransferase family 4 protein [Fibrobacter sp.]
MEQRFKLGVLFYFNPNWMGGINYIINIVKTLNFLEDKEKPEVFLFYLPHHYQYVKEINYPYLNRIKWNFPSIFCGNIISIIKRRNIFIDRILNSYELNAIFPLIDFPVRTRTAVKLIGWYADLQHEHYPEFFTRRKFWERTLRIKLILRNCIDLVVSSKAVADDFYRFFTFKEWMKIHIFHFVSVIDDFEDLDIDEIRARYKLPDDYYLISNQFHNHKNHRVLLKTLALMKKEGVEVHMVMTGRFPDANHSPYMSELHSLINENDLGPNIRMLGVIPRNEQLLLMRNARAVIQPSLFEGWSTVIEDAISLQVPVIASSLPVNIEQLGPDGCYFEPDDYMSLARILTNYPDREPGKMIYPEYSGRVRSAAGKLMRIFKS